MWICLCGYVDVDVDATANAVDATDADGDDYDDDDDGDGISRCQWYTLQKLIDLRCISDPKNQKLFFR